MVKQDAVLECLERIVAKAEAADYNLKFDVMYNGCKRLIRDLRPLPPITDWKNGHYGEQE